MELLHLRWSDVDIANATVQVQPCRADSFKVEGTEYPIIAWSAKARASYRSVPIPKQTAADLGRWRMERVA
jgi:integrase